MRLKNIVACLIIILVALFVYQDIFVSSVLVKSDSPIHFLEASFIYNEMIPQQHWFSGWFPYEYAGIPVGMYFYNGWIFLFLIVKFLFHTSDLFTFNLVFLLTIISAPLALFYVLKKRFGYIPAISAALFLILQRDFVKLHLAGMFGQNLAFAFLILAADRLDVFLKDKISKKIIAVVSILLALSIISHHYVTVAFAYFVVLAFLLKWYFERKVEWLSLFSF